MTLGQPGRQAVLERQVVHGRVDEALPHHEAARVGPHPPRATSVHVEGFGVMQGAEAVVGEDVRDVLAVHRRLRDRSPLAQGRGIW